jgi:hypothetical protein
MEEPRQICGFGINPGNIGTFARVATETTGCQVGRDGWPMMLLCDDVIDTERQRVEFVRQATILTEALSALEHKLAQ